MRPTSSSHRGLHMESMRARLLGPYIVLCTGLASSAATAQPADFTGDPRWRIRSQIEGQGFRDQPLTREAGRVELSLGWACEYSAVEAGASEHSRWYRRTARCARRGTFAELSVFCTVRRTGSRGRDTERAHWALNGASDEIVLGYAGGRTIRVTLACGPLQSDFEHPDPRWFEGDPPGASQPRSRKRGKCRAATAGTGGLLKYEGSGTQMRTVATSGSVSMWPWRRGFRDRT